MMEVVEEGPGAHDKNKSSTATDHSRLSVINQTTRSLSNPSTNMSKILIVFLVAMVAFQGCHGKPKGKAAATGEKTALEELAEKTESLVNNVTASLGIKEIPDSKQVAEAFNTQAQNLATKVQETVDTIKNEVKVHQPELSNLVKSVEAKLSETATSLQNAAGPEAQAKAKEIKANLDSGLKTAVEQIEKLVKAVQPDATKAKADVEKAAKQLLENISEISNNLKTQVEKTIEDHEKTHKH